MVITDANRKQIDKKWPVYYTSIGNSMQTVVTILSPPEYDEDTKIEMIEPGRTIIIGDIKDDLKQMFTELGKPTLNEKTAIEARPKGAFSTRAYMSMREYLFGDDEGPAPRARRSRNGS